MLLGSLHDATHLGQRQVSAQIALHDDASAQVVRKGITRRMFDVGVCQLKRPMYSIAYAINRAWLRSLKTGERNAIYRCPVCQFLHLTRNLNPSDGIACSWVAR